MDCAPDMPLWFVLLATFGAVSLVTLIAWVLLAWLINYVETVEQGE